MEAIKGKIVAVVSDSAIIINKGQEHGIVKDMLFSIRLQLPEITDPDDPENKLQGISFEKGRVKITTVFNKMSYATLIGETKAEFRRPNLALDAYLRPSIITSYPSVKDKILGSEDWIIKRGDEIIQVIEKPVQIIDKGKMIVITELPLDSLLSWGNSGGNPELVKDGGRNVIKVSYSSDKSGKHTNCSIHNKIPDVKKGYLLVSEVFFKCPQKKYGMLFIGDSGGADPYDNSVTEKKEGNGDWQLITASVKYKHDDECSIFLYGNRDDGTNGDAVLYKDIKIRIFSGE